MHCSDVRCEQSNGSNSEFSLKMGFPFSNFVHIYSLEVPPPQKKKTEKKFFCCFPALFFLKEEPTAEKEIFVKETTILQAIEQKFFLKRKVNLHFLN